MNADSIFSDDLNEIQNINDIDFKNLSLLHQIEKFTRNSYLNEYPHFENQYEFIDDDDRLEYLGIRITR
jgi:dsRNA-specific ribonuclease